MEKSTRTRSFVESTIVLVVANVLVKVIGALFSLPITNLIGEDGNGIFTVAYNIYTFMFIISSAGLPVAVSKMVAEANALGRQKEVKRIAKVSFTTFTILGTFFTVVMIVGADFFTRMIGNTMAYYAVLAIAPSIFFVCIVSAIRGYYQGLSNMVPTAISQVIEALGKLVIGLLCAYLLIQGGFSLEIVVAGSIAGVTIGTMLSAAYIVLVRVRDRSAVKLSAYSTECRSSGQIFKSLISIAVPVTISASVLSLTNLIDMGVVMNRLQDAGMTEPMANATYGAYGMSVKLFNMPQAFIVAIAVSIIPAISAAYARKNYLGAIRTTETAFRLTSLLALPCAFGLGVLARPIINLLYFAVGTEGKETAIPLLIILGPAIFFVAMVSVTNSVLQAMGKVRIPMITMVIGGVVKLIGNYFMVGNPNIMIHGAPIGTSLCYGTITVLNLIAIYQTGIHISYGKVFLRPLAASAVMGLFAFLIYTPLAGLIGSNIGLFITIGLSVVFYGLLLLAFKAVPKEDVLMLPKGEKIARLLKMK